MQVYRVVFNTLIVDFISLIKLIQFDGAFLIQIMRQQEELPMELVRVQDSDFEKAYDLFMTFKQDENGFINCAYGYSTIQELLKIAQFRKKYYN